jgi:hypothetical protein
MQSGPWQAYFQSRSQAPAWERHYPANLQFATARQRYPALSGPSPQHNPRRWNKPNLPAEPPPEAHRVVMQVVDLLLQHRLGDDLLGMKPFLPDLVVAPGLGRLLKILQLIQDPGLMIMFQLGDDALAGVALEIPDDLRQSVTRHNQVQMVVQDDIGIELQVFMLAAKLEGVEKKVKIGLPGEEGNPVDHRASDEVRAAGLSNGIMAFHGSRRRKGGEAELRPKITFPSWSLGTRKLVINPLVIFLTIKFKTPNLDVTSIVYKFIVYFFRR